MNSFSIQLKEKIEPLRAQIVQHKVYSAIHNLADLQAFMQHHIFAVWDFMSLLKALQHQLTCTTVPWFPKGNANIRYLINEIVVGEESDIDEVGNRKSHFELYLAAMQQSRANTACIEQFIANLQQTNDLEQAFESANVPLAARQFVRFTFSIIGTEEAYLQAAIFTFGREDLIPNMFMSIINDINSSFPESITIFKYYLERHIEVDGDHHSQLALEMVEQLCGTDAQRWQAAEKAVIQSLQQRIALWDGVYEQIMANRAQTTTNQFAIKLV